MFIKSFLFVFIFCFNFISNTIFFKKKIIENKDFYNFRFFYFFFKKFKKKLYNQKTLGLTINTVFALNIILDQKLKNQTASNIFDNKKFITKKFNLYKDFFKKKIYSIPNKNQISPIYQVFSFLKFFFKYNSLKINLLFLRKFRVFNKGRYSRNRQFYRTGVYWCLYINIIAVVGIYFWFYKITINYSYIWLILYLFTFAFVWSRFLNFFSIQNIVFFLKWNLNLISSSFNILYTFKSNFFKKIKLTLLFFI